MSNNFTCRGRYELLQISVYTSLEIQEQIDATIVVKWQYLRQEHCCDPLVRIGPKMRVVYTCPAVTTGGTPSVLYAFVQLKAETELVFSRTEGERI